MSGPATTDRSEAEAGGSAPSPPCVEVTDAREATVGSLTVRRALPRRGRRTVGAWCFADHIGPGDVDADRGPGVGPHPHIGLQTVTWLFSGEVLHRDSLGSEQPVRPGQLNLMTAGHGVAHAEEGTGLAGGPLHGIQLWVAQPEATRHGSAAFEHHPELPGAEVGGLSATVLVGSFLGATSPARRDTDHLGADLALRPGARCSVPLDPQAEHAVVVVEGVVSVDGRDVGPGRLAYLGAGRDECGLASAEAARAVLLGGVPFPEQVVMWWNYVGRDRDEIGAAHHDWTSRSGRFGTVTSRLDRVDVPAPPWERPT